MDKLKDKDKWGASFGELIWRDFAKSWLNVSCLMMVVFLLIIAVLAPFFANDKPFIICIDGRFYFPLFKNLQPIDYFILLVAVIVIFQSLLMHRNRKRVEPFRRPKVLLRQLYVGSSIILIGAFLIFTFVPRRLDATDYKALVESGKAAGEAGFDQTTFGGAIFTLVPYGYERTDLKSRQQPPSHKHWLGTDDVGSDVLCRLIYGSRVSLSVGFVAVGISSVIGIIFGAFMGYFGGKIDFIGMRIVEIVMAIPVFFLIITMVAFFSRSLLNIMIIIGLTSWMQSARLIRAEFLKLRKQDFIQAAISLGLGLRSILFKHMLANGIAPVLVNAAFGISSAIFFEAALSFLGFGVSPATPSWGQMLSLAVTTSGGFSWWQSLFPGLAIFLTVMAYNIIGQGLRDALDPRLRKYQ